MRLGMLLGIVVVAAAGAACTPGGDGASPPTTASTTTSTPAPVTTTTTTTAPPTTTATSTTTTTPPTTAPPPPPASSWPTAATTGVVDESVLTPWTGDCSLRTPGQVIEHKIFDCGPDIYAPGVTIRNSLIRGGEHWGVNVRVDGGDPVVLEHVTIDGGEDCNFASAIGDGHYRAIAVKVLNFGDAFRFSSGDAVVRDSYAKLCAPAGSEAHSDGLQGYRAPSSTADAPQVLEHSTIDQRCARWEGEGTRPENGTGDPDDRACSVTANVFWADDSGDGLVLRDNLFRGGGYTIRVHSGSGHTVVGNVVE
ncbi:MAG TPA: hypothetical protein VIL36_13180, partial [Acidimicrobiales bacterium]